MCYLFDGEIKLLKYIGFHVQEITAYTFTKYELTSLSAVLRRIGYFVGTVGDGNEFPGPRASLYSIHQGWNKL